MEVEISVRGSHRIYAPAERGTVQLSVEHQGPQTEQCQQATAAAATKVINSIRSLHDPQAGPITWWSSAHLRTWSERPWNNQGEQLPPVYHAQIDLRAKFSDFEVLRRWLTEIALISGVQIFGVEWALTEAHQEELDRKVRAAAVVSAKAKAQSYADALDLGEVQPRAIADVGLLGESDPQRPDMFAMSAKAESQASDGRDSELSPEDIEVSATVEARFAI